MERYLIILLLLIGSHGVSAQRISRQYNNVSMAQALKELKPPAKPIHRELHLQRLRGFPHHH